MATLTFERNTNTVGSPTWSAIAGGNRVVFSGSATDLTTSIVTTAWNDGTHIGTGTPGTDNCGGGPGGGAVHNNNVKFLTTGTMSVNGAASESITDTNLVVGECTLRVHMNNAVAVQTQNSFFFAYDNTTDTARATQIESYAFEQGRTNTAWVLINDDSAATGGDNGGSRLDVGENASLADSFWYFALSARGETAGGKSAFAYKLRTEVF